MLPEESAVSASTMLKRPAGIVSSHAISMIRSPRLWATATAGFVLPRSGLALKHGISVVNAPGLIDSLYRGELKVVLLNTDQSRPYHVHRGDRIAQLVIQRVEDVTWVEVDELDANDRGGGFGHSGR